MANVEHKHQGEWKAHALNRTGPSEQQTKVGESSNDAKLKCTVQMKASWRVLEVVPIPLKVRDNQERFNQPAHWHSSIKTFVRPWRSQSLAIDFVSIRKSALRRRWKKHKHETLALSVERSFGSEFLFQVLPRPRGLHSDKYRDATLSSRNWAWRSAFGMTCICGLCLDNVHIAQEAEYIQLFRCFGQLCSTISCQNTVHRNGWLHYLVHEHPNLDDRCQHKGLGKRRDIESETSVSLLKPESDSSRMNTSTQNAAGDHRI